MTDEKGADGRHAAGVQNSFEGKRVSCCIHQSETFQRRNAFFGFGDGWVAPAAVDVSFFFAAEPAHALFGFVEYIRAAGINGNQVGIIGIGLMACMNGCRAEAAEWKFVTGHVESLKFVANRSCFFNQ